MGLPFVSVIIPTFNSGDSLKECLQALYRQTYPYNQYEVMVVDNGSTDDIKGVCKHFPNVRYLHESKRGSYAARNCGIREAKGEIIAFTDADCVPSADWIASGVRALLDADLIAGHIQFTFHYRNAVEYLDSLMHLNQERYATAGYAATANAFTYAWVFSHVGLFNERLLSLGDREWGERVSRAGYRVAYSSEAIVFHPARATLKALLTKIRLQTQHKALLKPWRWKDVSGQLQPVNLRFYQSLMNDPVMVTPLQKLEYFLVFYRVKYAIAIEMLMSIRSRY